MENTQPSAEVLTYAAPGTVRHKPSLSLSPAFATAAIVLSALSLFVFFHNMDNEPFYGGVSRSDALIQVGLGSALVALWTVWSVALSVAAARRLAHLSMLVLLVWAALAVLILVACVDGFLEERNQGWMMLGPSTRAAAPATSSGSTGAEVEP